MVGIDPQRGGITIDREDGKHEALDLSRLADRHIRPGWVRTIHSAQGATADRVMAHLESFRANTVDAPAVYVAISRAKDAVGFYTDSCTKLLTRRRVTFAQNGFLNHFNGMPPEVAG